MKRNRFLTLGLLAVLCATLCGCTTAGKYTGQYFNHVGSRVETWLGSDSAKSGDDANSGGKTALAAPANFKVDGSGAFQFDGVDGAENYTIYLYDAQTGDGKYSSSSITGSGTISGSLADYGACGYGHFRAEVVAYPAMSDNTHKKSAPVTCEVTMTGEAEAAEVTYCWDCFAGTLEVQLSNVEDYLTSAFPTKVEVTFTNTADSSDVVTLGFENVSLENDVFYASTTEVTRDATYAVSAVVEFPDVVTSGSQTLDLGTLTTAGDASFLLDGFAYARSGVYSYADFPIAADIDPNEGGQFAVWHYYKAYSVSDKGIATPASLTGDDIYFTAQPAETVTESSAYSWTIRMANGEGKIVSTGGWGGSTEMAAGVGVLECYPDGTFLLTITGSEGEDAGAEATAGVGVDGGEIPAGFGPSGTSGVTSSEVKGTWKNNGDGTIHLSVDLSTAVSTGTSQGGGFPGM